MRSLFLAFLLVLSVGETARAQAPEDGTSLDSEGSWLEPVEEDAETEGYPTEDQPVRRSGPAVGAFVTMGIGAALLVGGAVTGIFALDVSNDLEDDCVDGACPESVRDDRNRGVRLAVATDLLFIAGGATIASGLIWALLTRNSEEEAPLSLGCGAEGCALQVQGAF
ncbi:MAG: hypothetical protein AAGF12_17805 [Myxococcota bacterium]